MVLRQIGRPYLRQLDENLELIGTVYRSSLSPSASVSRQLNRLVDDSNSFLLVRECVQYRDRCNTCIALTPNRRLLRRDACRSACTVDRLDLPIVPPTAFSPPRRWRTRSGRCAALRLSA